MASGLPVIVTDAGGARESVCDGETGLVARAGDAESLAEMVLRLARAPEEMRAMGRRARAAALEAGWDRAFEALDADYEALTTEPEEEPVPAGANARNGGPPWRGR